MYKKVGMFDDLLVVVIAFWKYVRVIKHCLQDIAENQRLSQFEVRIENKSLQSLQLLIWCWKSRD